MPHVKDNVGRCDAADPAKSRRVIAHTLNPLDLVFREVRDFRSQCGAVFWGDGVNEIGASDAVCPGHIGHDNPGMPGYVISKVTRRHAGIEVVAAANRVIHVDGNGLALEIVVRLGVGGCGTRSYDANQRYEQKQIREPHDTTKKPVASGCYYKLFQLRGEGCSLHTRRRRLVKTSCVEPIIQPSGQFYIVSKSATPCLDIRHRNDCIVTGSFSEGLFTRVRKAQLGCQGASVRLGNGLPLGSSTHSLGLDRGDFKHITGGRSRRAAPLRRALATWS